MKSNNKKNEWNDHYSKAIRELANIHLNGIFGEDKYSERQYKNAEDMLTNKATKDEK